MCSVIVFDVLDLALFLCDLQDIHLKCAVVLLEFVRLIANFPTEKALH